MTPIRLALDWTPNINHIGFFMAMVKGYYKDAGIDVTISDPGTDNYARTPAKKVELGEADLALCPTESVISYRTKNKPFDLIGIATVFQKDVSAIAVREGEGIDRPRDLDGKRYASYEARYEDQIVRQMIKNDGGTGELTISYPHKLGIWETVYHKTHDATWVFLNWEGIEAKDFDIKLRYFKMEEYGIPYSYSPLLVASERKARANAQVYSDFVQASKKGFEFCVQSPEEAVSLFAPFVPEKDKHIHLNEALQASIPAFGNDWGRIDPAVVGRFLEWIYAQGLEHKPLRVEEVVTNDYRK